MASLCQTLQQLNETGVNTLLEQHIVHKSKLMVQKVRVTSQKEKPDATEADKVQCKIELDTIKENLQNNQNKII